jgi:predicted transcriptional regulator
VRNTGVVMKRIFSSNLRIKLLCTFLTNSEERFYARELGRKLGKDAKNISLELKNLADFGLLSTQREGNLKYYFVNKDFFLYPELKAVFTKAYRKRS